jgi:hypothetical protein
MRRLASRARHHTLLLLTAGSASFWCLVLPDATPADPSTRTRGLGQLGGHRKRDLEREVACLREEVDHLRQQRVLPAPSDDTMLGRDKGWASGCGGGRGGGVQMQQMQQTLHPFLARPRPASAIAHAVVFASPLKGCAASRRDAERGAARAAGPLGLEEAHDGLDDSSSRYFDSDVEEAIVNDVAAQAHVLALSRTHAPLSFEPVRTSSGSRNRGADVGDDALQSPDRGTAEKDVWSGAYMAKDPWIENDRLAKPLAGIQRTCHVPADLPSLIAAVARRKKSITLDGAPPQQWLGTLALTGMTCISGGARRATAVGGWELAAEAGGALLSLTLRNEHGSTISITQGSWRLEHTSIRSAGAAVIRSKLRHDGSCQTTVLFCAYDSRVEMRHCELGGISARQQAGWGIFCSGLSRAEAASCRVHTCAESGVASIGSARVNLRACTVDACAVALCVDDGASVRMLDGTLQRSDFALEAGFNSGSAASLALDRVVIRSGGPQELWRSGQRPARFNASRLHYVAGPARPLSSSFSFASRVRLASCLQT